MPAVSVCLFLWFTRWFWGSNSGLCVCKASAFPLSRNLQPKIFDLRIYILSINVMHLKDRHYVFNWLTLKNHIANCRIFRTFKNISALILWKPLLKVNLILGRQNYLFFLAFEKGSHVSQASLGLPLWLRLALNTWPSCLCLPCARIICRPVMSNF